MLLGRSISRKVAFLSPMRFHSTNPFFASAFVSHNHHLTATKTHPRTQSALLKTTLLPRHSQHQQDRTFAALSARLSKSMNKTRRNQNPTKKELHRADKILATRTDLSRSQAAAIIKQRRLGYRLPAHDIDIMEETGTDPIADTSTNTTTTTNTTKFVQSVPGPKFKLPMDVTFYLDRKEVPKLPPTLIVHHKDKFILSAMKDETSKKHLGQVLPSRIAQVKAHPVGRLDYDTSGLILFSQSGQLTQRLLHPKFAVEKEYEAVVLGDATVKSGDNQDDEDDFDLKRALQDGVETTEGTHTAKLTHATVLKATERRLIVKSHQEGEKKHGREGALWEEKDLKSIVLSRVRLVVQEGKYRMVRRMLANCGHAVVELKRLRHGNIELGDLGVGEFRDCTPEEMDWAEGLFVKKENGDASP